MGKSHWKHKGGFNAKSAGIMLYGGYGDWSVNTRAKLKESLQEDVKEWLNTGDSSEEITLFADTLERPAKVNVPHFERLDSL